MIIKFDDLLKIKKDKELRTRLDNFLKNTKKRVDEVDECDCNVDFPIDFLYHEILMDMNEMIDELCDDDSQKEEIIRLYLGFDVYLVPLLIKTCNETDFNSLEVSEELLENFPTEKEIDAGTLHKAYRDNLKDAISFFEKKRKLLPKFSRKFIKQKIKKRG